MLFDYTIAHWVTFFTAAILLNLSPGPDILFILAQTAKHGRRIGFLAMFGIWAGAFIHVLLAALGLSTILATSATAFLAIKWIGAAYLVFLGLQAIRASGSSLSPQKELITSNPYHVFRQGLLVSVLNPKVAIFFLAFLPQFVVEGAGSISSQLFLHGALIIAVAAFIEPPLVILGARLTHHLKTNPRISTWMNRGIGGLLIGLGLRLAFTERT